jgi:hypothetical protein
MDLISELRLKSNKIKVKQNIKIYSNDMINSIHVVKYSN